jgi:DNA-binding CsgD family transcriptional regulator
MAGTEPGDGELDAERHASECLEDVVERSWTARETLAQLIQLPPRQRQAIVATALHGESRAAVAMQLGVSEGTVRQLVHRARHNIRTAMAGLSPLPLVRWLVAAVPSAAGTPELLTSAGAGGAGGVAARAGALVVGAVLATGGLALVSAPEHSRLPGHGSHVARSAPAASRSGAAPIVRPARPAPTPRVAAATTPRADRAALDGGQDGPSGDARPSGSSRESSSGEGRDSSGGRSSTSDGGGHGERRPPATGGSPAATTVAGGQHGTGEGSSSPGGAASSIQAAGTGGDGGRGGASASTSSGEDGSGQRSARAGADGSTSIAQVPVTRSGGGDGGSDGAGSGSGS